MMIRKLALSTVFASLAATAFAADLPTRKAPEAFVPVPVFTWTGFYVGGQLGYNWGNDRTSEFVTATGAFTGFTSSYSPNGVVGGTHAGFNYQMGSIVLGIEGDLELSGYKGGYRLANGNGTDTKKDFQGSIRGRFGFAFDRALIYATGGLALANFKHTYVNAGLARTESFSDTRAGWTLGAGLEYAFSRNWSGRVEYRYTDFGNFRNANAFAFPGFTYKQEPRDHTIRAGISYRF